MRQGSGSPGSVLIVGGGIIGLTCAWRLARDGWKVTLFDAAVETREASWAAAGMLAPHNEADGPGPLWQLGCAGLARWPTFLAETGMRWDEVGYGDQGSLVPVVDDDDERETARRAAFLTAAGVPVIEVSGADLQRQEPALASGIRRALLLPGARVAPRLVVARLRAWCETAGVDLHFSQSVRQLDGRQVTLDDGRCLSADQVVVACGAWTPGLAAATGIALDGMPVKGQMLRFAAGGFLLSRFIHSRHAYLVPRPDGGLVVGATMAETGFARDEDVSAIAALAAGARRLVPALEGVAIAETWTGLRPRLVHGLPVIARHDSGLVIATGHFRNGILLGPITADLVADLVSGRDPDPGLPRFPLCCT